MAFTGLSARGMKKCKQCSSTAPTCPACPSGTVCTMVAQTCNQCAHMKCIKSSTGASSSQSNNSSGGGTNTGAIAGGVIAGLALLGIIMFLIWWFVIRKKRQERTEAEKNGNFAAARQERQSTQSIASTVLTRASNVIQIAYIPGVTNRSEPQTPASLVPPVPPLPGAAPDQHFFMPGDLRDSSWTTTTGHQSMSPTVRSSVASTVYRNDAIVSQTPAQQISSGRANVVSIHNGSGPSTPAQQPTPIVVTPADAPAVPAITPAQLAKAEKSEAKSTPGSSIVARTVQAKPVMVRGPSLKKKKTADTNTEQQATQSETPAEEGNPQFTHQNSTFDGNTSDEENDATPAAESVNSQNESSADASNIPERPNRGESPFSDANRLL